MIPAIIVICLIGFNNLTFSAYAGPGDINIGNASIEFRNVTVYAPAVGMSEGEQVGVISTITVSIQSKGSGRVFLDTLPLAQVDMQGSARLAVKVASALVKNDENCSTNPDNYDYFFVVRTSSPIIGGPSAGAIMTVATIALLENWDMDNRTVMTGMINPDGSIGPVGGIPKKIDAAYLQVGAKRFLVPKGQGTYVDYVTETTTTGGGIVQSVKPVRKTLEQYIEEKSYNIELIEVADIREVVQNYTGYSFSSGSSSIEIKTEEYLNVLEPLASTLLEEASDLYKEANDLYNSSKNNIPYRVWDWDEFGYIYYQRDVEDALSYAKLLKIDGEDWYQKDKFYTSITKSFQSLIDSRFVLYVCQYFNTNENSRDELINNLLYDASELLENKSNLARNSKIEGVMSLQFVGAAQKRASQAEEHLTNAQSLYNANNYYSSIPYLARAYERCKSVGWWINISEGFNESEKINSSEIDTLALEYIEDAQQSITYSSILIEETGESSDFLDEAENLLQSARDERDKGYPASALFKALEAITRANLEIETIGLDNQTEFLEKIEMVNESTSSKIGNSLHQNIEPTLSVCYYEYAESLLEENDLSNALFYFRYSGMIAGALIFTNISKGSTSSRYVGISTPNLPSYVNECKSSITKESLAILFFLGALVGLGIGIIIVGIVSRKQESKIKEKWTPRSLMKYKNQEKYKDDFNSPSNIEDYYKRNK